MEQKIIIDTDPGVDDALAIFMASRSHKLDVLAITTVAGNSKIINVTRNAHYIREISGIANVPIYSGAERPLQRDLVCAKSHGPDGLFGLGSGAEPSLNGYAVENIINLVEMHPNEITIIALGPLTNIAKAIQMSPLTMANVKQIVCMGGALRAKGNMTNLAEFNFFVDPEAAQIVCDFSADIILVPLDVCNLATMPIVSIEEVSDINLRKVMSKMVKPYAKNIQIETGSLAAIMYDPLAVYYVISPESFKTEEVAIYIGDGAVDRGAILVKANGKNALNTVTIATGLVDNVVFSNA